MSIHNEIYIPFPECGHKARTIADMVNKKPTLAEKTESVKKKWCSWVAKCKKCKLYFESGFQAILHAEEKHNGVYTIITIIPFHTKKTCKCEKNNY